MFGRIDRKKITDNKLLANKFNSYFVTSIKNNG